jgi:hypothetical protein
VNGKEARLSSIKLLLDHYLDVVQGLRDRGNGDEGLALMCDAWNGPGYRRLEERRKQMILEERSLYRHLHQAYFDQMSRYEKRVLACPACEMRVPAWSSTTFHTHGRRHVRLAPRVDKVYVRPLNTEGLRRGEAWLERRWGRDILIPDILRPFVSTTPVSVL